VEWTDPRYMLLAGIEIGHSYAAKYLDVLAAGNTNDVCAAATPTEVMALGAAVIRRQGFEAMDTIAASVGLDRTLVALLAGPDALRADR
jgi:hypothetical protein